MSSRGPAGLAHAVRPAGGLEQEEGHQSRSTAGRATTPPQPPPRWCRAPGPPRTRAWPTPRSRGEWTSVRGRVGSWRVRPWCRGRPSSRWYRSGRSEGAHSLPGRTPGASVEPSPSVLYRTGRGPSGGIRGLAWGWSPCPFVACGMIGRLFVIVSRAGRGTRVARPCPDGHVSSSGPGADMPPGRGLGSVGAWRPRQADRPRLVATTKSDRGPPGERGRSEPHISCILALFGAPGGSLAVPGLGSFGAERGSRDWLRSARRPGAAPSLGSLGAGAVGFARRDRRAGRDGPSWPDG